MTTLDPEHRAFAEAVYRNDVAAAKLALESWPDARNQINAPVFHFGQRATHFAANNFELLDLLLAHGADITLESDWDKGPFSVLDHADEDHARGVIARGVPLTANVASRLGWFDELRALVEADPARVHDRGGDGKQPLHEAHTPEIADYLLTRGADIDGRCWDHQSTPAQYALVDRTPVCQRLLERGAIADIFMAAWLGDRPLAERLVDVDPSCLAARINEPGYTAVPPFNIYCWTIGFQRSPHDVARSRGHDQLLAWLTERSPLRVRLLDAAASGNEAAAGAALSEDPSVVRSLTPAEHGQLAQAIFYGRAAPAKLMLDLEFDPAGPGVDGGSALHAACWRGNVGLVDRLVAQVSVELRDPTHGSTPLGWTAFGSVHCADPNGDYVAIVDRLVAAGANITAPANGSGDSLVDLAEGCPAVQEAVRQHLRKSEV